MEADRLKILIIRFNSIGDIVLSSPVIRALKKSGHEIHYLAKSAYGTILEDNPYLDKIWVLENSLGKVINELKSVNFDLIIDLHNNFRSKRVCRALKLPFRRLKKERLNMWLLTMLNINRVRERHIVNRFLDTVKDILKESQSDPYPEYYFPDGEPVVLKHVPEEPFMAVVVGAAFKTKQIPIEKIVEIIDGVKIRSVLIGGPEDVEDAWKISQATRKKVDNWVGKMSISGSAYMISKARVVLSGDTGMMHIAAALNKPLIAVFGSTHPILGYSPYNYKERDNIRLIQNNNLACRPCTKQGRTRCPLGHFKCMKDIRPKEIIENIRVFI